MSKIQDFITHVVAVPREPGASTDRTDRPPATVFVTLQLRTNDGIEGIGHATLVPWSMNEALKAAVDALAQEVVGRNPMGLESIVADLYWAAGAGSTAWGGRPRDCRHRGGPVGYSRQDDRSARPQAAGRIHGPSACIRQRQLLETAPPGGYTGTQRGRSSSRDSKQ